MRLRSLGPAAALVLAAVSAEAQVTAPPKTQPIAATSKIDQSLTLTIVTNKVDCGTVVVTAPTACNVAATPATVNVLANSDWTLAIEDLGGAAGSAVSLWNASGARNGHFVVNLALQATSGTPTGLSGQNVNVTATGIQTGSAAAALDYTDEWGVYEGDFLVTLSGS